ncbi:acyltransferase [Zafaria cholistanensis]|uniref:Acyltransferase n=1 Tax=Zafaria cholistanensis TaxID=1682741 RepID=A0A5A7NQF3_9MICC|nr:acyltransferase family protein [Zafaria cholistanensis]GER23040.1 acyltransferase [Zafaria cholistanensis]
MQALRALAVLLVVFYHFTPGLVPGGFVGVDVFFVISGFLITGHLLREARATGRIDLPAFWAGRVRRILPAALATVAAVVAATLLLEPETQWGQASRQALASVFSVQNWVLAADAVDYLAAEHQPTALQHFWSLGVEEQFYLFWPLLAAGAAALAARPGALAVLRAALGDRLRTRFRDPFRALVGALFGAVAAASLGWSIHLTGTGDPAAYFATPTRVWELAAGGLLALGMAPGQGAEQGDGKSGGSGTGSRWLRRHRLWHPGLWRPWLWSGPARAVVALAGFAAVAAAAFGYDAATPFPGSAAALPVAGTAAVIAAGRTSGPLALNRLLGLAPVQWMGEVSYSLYLWHWPVRVFLGPRITGWGPAAHGGAVLLLLPAALLLAAASHRFIEVPARRFAPLAASRWRTLAAGTAAVVLAAALAAVPAVWQEAVVAAQQGAVGQLLAEPPPDFGASAAGPLPPAYVGGSRTVVPVPARAEQDRPRLGPCIQAADSGERRECEFGAADGALTVALIGDSHAVQWYEPMLRTAERNGWGLVTYLKNSCPFTAATRTLELQGRAECARPNRLALERILERGDIDAVVTSYWGGAEFAGSAAEGFAAYWERLEDAGIKVYPIVDTPRPGHAAPAPDCVVKHAPDPRPCGAAEGRAFERADATRRAAGLEPRVEVLDFRDRFCSDGFCPAVVGNVLVYRDHHHVTDTYMRTLAPEFADRLGSALRADGLDW